MRYLSKMKNIINKLCKANICFNCFRILEKWHSMSYFYAYCDNCNNLQLLFNSDISNLKIKCPNKFIIEKEDYAKDYIIVTVINENKLYLTNKYKKEEIDLKLLEIYSIKKYLTNQIFE